ncbi:MAG: glycoside hydrolase family 38 C-terminal domain-containing protein, partial [Nocardioides sp.]
MHDRRAEIRGRLRRIVDQHVRPAERRHVADLTVVAWHVPPAADGPVGEPVPFSSAREQEYDAFAIGEPWGPAWATTWFRLTGTVPADLAHPELMVDLGFQGGMPGFQSEGLVLRPDGTHVKALNPFNDWVPVTVGEDVELYVEAAANPHVLTGWNPTTLGDRLTSGSDPVYRLLAAAVVDVDPEVRELLADIEVLDQLAAELREDDARQVEILLALEKALDALDLTDVPSTASTARAELATALGRPAYDGAHRLSAVGHAHIDSAWLWPVRETVRKVARTVSNVVALLDDDPDLVYAMSSAQQWEWVRVHHPALFERVKEHAAAGRFVPAGGMWVESDTNMVGGEAMARQFLVGQRWFEEHLGTLCEEVWLPDSFGYTAALPQIVTLAGARWFLTQKISWNTTNVFPHHTFWWEGIDGTRVFTHFPPVDTYEASLTGRELAHAARNFRDKGAATRSLVPFGFGDGGGGPTREMLGRARRTTSLAGSPVVALESPTAFFEAAHEEYADAPVWAGELYLEIHRGTYTSQAAMKQGNRRSEHLLREAELWSATAAVSGLLPYPADELEELWRIVLLHQFHDILPGSSIAWVHREARATYADVALRLGALVDRALDALAGEGGDEVVFNAGPVERGGIPSLAGGFEARSARTSTTDTTLENERLRVELDEGGVIRSVLDKAAGREVLPPGGVANLLQLHPDHPVKWDAWDLDRSYRSSVTDLVGGEVSAEDDAVVVRHGFGSSTAVQRMWLDGGLLICEVDVDWHEREKVLKAAFDVDVHTDHAAYETQFGHVVRPTHENTTWDAARFEVCAHRWVRLADGGYGVGLANDATYGHDVTRHPRDGGGTYSRVRLSLLRAPLFPDPETDQGRHVLRYALVPGASVADAAEAGYALNLPLRRRTGSAVEPLVRVDGPAYVEAVKLAADGSGDVIVRLYEPLGARS